MSVEKVLDYLYTAYADSPWGQGRAVLEKQASETMAEANVVMRCANGFINDGTKTIHLADTALKIVILVVSEAGVLLLYRCCGISLRDRRQHELAQNNLNMQAENRREIREGFELVAHSIDKCDATLQQTLVFAALVLLGAFSKFPLVAYATRFCVLVIGLSYFAKNGQKPMVPMPENPSPSIVEVNSTGSLEGYVVITTR